MRTGQTNRPSGSSRISSPDRVAPRGPARRDPTGWSGNPRSRPPDRAFADRHSDSLTPAPLGESAVAELLRRGEHAPVDEQFARACHHASGGNPFLLTELERTLRGTRSVHGRRRQARGRSDSAQVARAIRARLARLSPPGASARSGRRGARRRLTAGASGGARRAGPDGRHQRPRTNRRSGTVEPGRLIRFRHPILRSAVAGSLTLAGAEGSHLAAASSCASAGSSPERSPYICLPRRRPARSTTADTAHRRRARRRARRAGGSVPLLQRALEEPVGATSVPSFCSSSDMPSYAAGHSRPLPTSSPPWCDPRDVCPRARALAAAANIQRPHSHDFESI